eukprot:TRINITY_DN1435_c0_g1_i2.p1 TRINITY_DN1435_c0_g1~~TRINITY_DN1435_c0_g1_i2.p1  ORF type:complete len:461 (-),score=34.71 TRINITY_DN1435_c0_g1_i2:1107-2489(-)
MVVSSPVLLLPLLVLLVSGGISARTEAWHTFDNEQVDLSVRGIHAFSGGAEGMPLGLSERRIMAEASATVPAPSCNSSLYLPEVAAAFKQAPALVWVPQPERFLLMHCALGKLSARVMCYRKAILYAGLLNRTLLVIVDEKEISSHYDRHILFDMEHARSCYGSEMAILTSEEYEKKYQDQIIVDQVLCWGGCPFRGPPKKFLSDYFKLWKRIRFEDNLEVKYAPLGESAKMADFVTEFGKATGRVLYLGMCSFGEIEEFPDLRPGIPMRGDFTFAKTKTCPSNLAVQPHGAIIETAKEFVKAKFGGEPFVAVHLRRGDYKGYCTPESFTSELCHRPWPKIIKCLNATLRADKISTIFLATDAGDAEVDQLIADIGFPIKLVRVFLSPRHPEEWQSPLRKQNWKLLFRGTHLAVVDKMVAVFASVFIGTPTSTFSGDIERMRYGMGTATCQDKRVCDGQL